MTSANAYNGRRVTKMRGLVFALYGTTCHLCGKPGADTVDHLVPLHAGGSVWGLDNLRPAHLACNVRRGHLTRSIRRALVVNATTPPHSRDW